MKYRSSSVIEAIKGSSEIEVDSPLAHCPRTESDLCKRLHGNCQTGKRQQCKQRVSVFINGCLRHLIFYFTVSITDSDGFIDSNDSQLSILIKDKLINKETLLGIQ